MTYEEHEKMIYMPQGWTGEPFDPLALLNRLTIASEGKLNNLLSDWSAVSDGQGDISVGAAERNAVTSAAAELELARIAKAAFDLPPFPESTDAQALELLSDFCAWIEGKGKRAMPPQSRPASSPEALDLEVIMNS